MKNSTISKAFNYLKDKKSNNIIKVNKDNLIKSKEFFDDLKKIKKSNTFSQISKSYEDLHYDFINIDYLSNIELKKDVKRMRIIDSLNKHKISLEYINKSNLFSIESYDSFMARIKLIITKIKKFIYTLSNKVISIILAVIKKIQVFINKIVYTIYNNLYKKFKPEDFKNINAIIEVTPVTKNIFKFNNILSEENEKEKKFLNEMFKEIEIDKNIKDQFKSFNFEKDEKIEVIDEKIQKLGIDILFKNAKDFYEKSGNTFVYSLYLDKQRYDINKTLFGVKEPIKKKITVGEYLDCKPGERPDAIEFLKSSFGDSLFKALTDTKESIRYAKIISKTSTYDELISLYETSIKLHKEKTYESHEALERVRNTISNIEKVDKVMLSALNIYSQSINYKFKLFARITSDIYKAIKTGLNSKQSENIYEKERKILDFNIESENEAIDNFTKEEDYNSEFKRNEILTADFEIVE